MNGRVDQKLKDELRRIATATVGPNALVGFEVEPYVDHNDEDALRILLVLAPDRVADVDRLTVMTDLFDALMQRGVGLFPYTTFALEGEAA